MSAENLKIAKNISGISSNISYIRDVASGINFSVRAETVIIRSLSEQLYVMVRDTCHTIEKGNFIAIDPFISHSIIVHPEKAPQEYEMLALRATTDSWERKSCFSFGSAVTTINAGDRYFGDFSTAFSKVAEAMSALDANGNASLPRLLSVHALTEMLCALMIDSFSWHENPSPIFESWDIFEDSIKFICDNLSSDLSLDEISAKSGLSTFYFSHKYKEIFGTTVMRNVNHLKLCKSAAMLIQSNASISEIALSCGFGSVATYCSVFKKFYTFTPMAMRRKKTLLSK